MALKLSPVVSLKARHALSSTCSGADSSGFPSLSGGRFFAVPLYKRRQLRPLCCASFPHGFRRSFRYAAHAYYALLLLRQRRLSAFENSAGAFLRYATTAFLHKASSLVMCIYLRWIVHAIRTQPTGTTPMPGRLFTFPATDQRGYHESAPFAKFNDFRTLCMSYIAPSVSMREFHMYVQTRAGFACRNLRSESDVKTLTLCEIAYHPLGEHKLVGGQRWGCRRKSRWCRRPPEADL